MRRRTTATAESSLKHRTAQVEEPDMQSLTSTLEGRDALTPFELVAQHTPAVRRTKRELLAESRRLEDLALAQQAATVLVTFQEREHLTARSRDSYARLAKDGCRVFAFARGLVPDYRPESWGLRTVALLSTDALVSEWDIVVLGPRVARAFTARDLSPGRAGEGLDLERPFSWATTSDRQLVEQAADALLTRVPAQHH